MVFQQENAAMNLYQDAIVTPKSEQEVLEPLGTSDESKSPAGRSRPSSPRWAVVRLLKRISFLKENGDESMQPEIKLVWPEGFEPPSLSSDSTEALWQEILVKFYACEAPAKLAAYHFDSIIQVGMDANSVLFPCMLARKEIVSDFPAEHARPWRPPGPCKHRLGESRLPCKSHGTEPCTDIPSHVSKVSVSHQDTVAFPLFSDVAARWTNQEEKEALDMLIAGRAKDPHALRPKFYSKPPLDMELLPWPSLLNGVVAADICTDAQAKVLALREKFPLSMEQVDKRRAALAKTLGGKLNRRVFAECMPELEHDAAILELQAARAHDKVVESARYEELAMQGSKFVVWPVPHARRWPEQSRAWKNHCKWFAMWRSQPLVASELAFKPMKRSSSLSSIGSWAAVSDISWIEIESKASECGWQEILDEQVAALSSAKPSDIPKADLQEIKSFAKPPRGVALTMEVMCVLLQVPPIKLTRGVDYWQASKDLLGQVDFLTRLSALVEYLPSSALDAVTPYMSLDDFAPEVIGKSSLACKSLCSWAHELYKYHTLKQAAAEAAWNDYARKPSSELLSESQEALEELPKAALQELKCLSKPPAGIDVMGYCFLHLFAGIAPEVELTKKGNVKDISWSGFQRFLSNPDAAFKRLLDFKTIIDAGMVPAKNVQKVRKVLKDMGPDFTPEFMRAKSAAAVHLCKWLMSTIAYCEHAVLVEQQDRSARSLPSQKASKCLSKADIVEIKSLASPPQPVMIVCMCICILLGKDESSGWAGAKAMISDVRFLKTLLEHKKEDVTSEQITRVRELINKEKETFHGENMKAVSKAAYGLLQWVFAMIEEE